MRNQFQKKYSIYSDLKQLERELSWTPSDFIIAILKIGKVVSCELDIGRQEIIDGEVVHHPVLDCVFSSEKDIEDIQKVLSPDFFVVDLISEKIEIADTVSSPFDTVSANKLDQLVGELLLINYQQKRLADWSNPKQKANAEHLDFIAHKLQNLIKQDQFVAFNSIAAEIQNFAKKIAKDENKSAHLWLDGGHESLEKAILDQLIRPIKLILSSICKNSIESAQDRKKYGKAEEAEIVFRIQAFDEHLEVHIEDDGQGLSAEETGKLLEKVKPILESLNGSTGSYAVSGTGASIRFRLHRSLSIIPCYNTKTNGNLFAIPESQVKQIVAITPEESVNLIEIAGKHFYFHHEKEVIPCLFFEEILNFNGVFDDNIYEQILKKHSLPLNKSVKSLICQTGTKKFALLCSDVSLDHVLVSQRNSSTINIFSGMGWSELGQSVFIVDTFTIGENALNYYLENKRKIKKAA